jgi:hypothetical protein
LAFLKRTIAVAQAARPKARWGIDGYVTCGDAMDDYRGVAEGNCPVTAMKGNDKLRSLLAVQDIVVPMSYILSTNASFNEGTLSDQYSCSTEISRNGRIFEW